MCMHPRCVRVRVRARVRVRVRVRVRLRVRARVGVRVRVRARFRVGVGPNLRGEHGHHRDLRTDLEPEIGGGAGAREAELCGREA